MLPGEPVSTDESTDLAFDIRWSGCQSASDGGHGEGRKTGDGVGTLNTEEKNGPRLRPMAH